MPKALVTNYDNNFGDCLAEMGVLKEWKEMNPDWEMDFISPFWLHYLAAKHTDLFDKVTYLRDRDYIIGLRTEYPKHGYDRVIDFKIDFGRAVQIGLKKAWGEGTLQFTPKDDKPYFIMTPDEGIVGDIHFEQAHAFGRKVALIQLSAPSNESRGFLPEDWNKVLDLIPEDVVVLHPCPIGTGLANHFSPRKNLLVLPGYGIGETARLMQLVDVNIVVHGGFAHLAYAVDAWKTVQINMANVSGGNLLRFTDPQSTDLYFPSNTEIDWNLLKESINKYL